MSLQQFAQGMASLSSFHSFSQMPQSVQVGVLLLLAWTLVWKGLALWRAGGKQDKVWFIVLLIVNTVGILEILYLYVFSKKQKEDILVTTQEPPQKPQAPLI